MRKIYPVPELVLDDYIRVDDTRDGHEGSMDNQKRIMRVPLMDTPACRHVRAHEMAHGKYSPEKPVAPKGIPEMVIQRVEDMRMNRYCRKQGLDEAMDAPVITDSETWGRVLPNDPVAKLTAGVSTFNTGDWGAWKRYSRPSKDDIAFIESLWDEMGDSPSWDDTLSLSHRVVEYLDLPEAGDGGGGGGDGSGEDSGSGDSEGDGEKTVDLTGDIMDDLVDRELERAEVQAGKSPFEKGLETLEEAAETYGGRGRDASIGKLDIVRRPLTQRMAPSKFKSRAKVPADRGMYPRYMHRYCSDKAIFSGRGRKRDHGGTILIDASGSMHISHQDIDNIMNIAPLGTIASYSGLGHSGELWIIAEKGKRAVGKLRPPMLGNVVDVQSLQWMVKQPGPHYWVCDGIVSGSPRAMDSHSEVFGKNIFDMCIELVETHGIIMVPMLEALPKVMRETL